MRFNKTAIQFLLLRELGIGIVAYSPLGRGFLSSGTKLLENLTQDDARKVCENHAITKVLKFMSITCASSLPNLLYCLGILGYFKALECHAVTSTSNLGSLEFSILVSPYINN